MDEQPVPIVVGTHGLTGRTQIVRVPDLEDAEDEHSAPARGRVLPSNCWRNLQLGGSCNEHRGVGFDGPCLGQQDDGTCLLSIVRAATAAGIDWQFETRQDGDTVRWEYVGPPIPE